MRKVIAVLGLLLVPLFASAANESICDVHKDGFTKEEKLACGIEMAKNSKILLSVSDATDKKVTEIGAAFLGSQFDINVSDTSELQNSESAFTALLGGQHYVSQKIIGWLFVAVGAIGYLFLLWAGAIKGKFIEGSSAVFLVIMLCIGASCITGHFYIFLGLLVFLAATMGTVFFFPIISLIGDISSDVKSEQTNFSMDARAFADTATTYLIQSNMQDLVARKSLLVETGNVNKSGITNKYKIGEEKFQTCLENTIAPAMNYKFYVQPEFEITQKCVFKELDYKEYRIGSISDSKLSDVSKNLIAAIHAESPAARDLAFDMLNTVCSGVYSVDEDSVDGYLSICLDMTKEGRVVLDGEGLASTVKAESSRDFDEIKNRRTQISERLAAVAFKEQITNANKVDKSTVENIGYDNMFAAFNVGEVYRAAYKAAGNEVLDININLDVAIRKSSFKQFFGIEENLDLFGGNGSIDSFGIVEYEQQFQQNESFREYVLKTVNIISGDSATDIGATYEDCFKKDFCNSGTSNIFSPLFKVAHRVAAVLGVYMITSEALSSYYEKLKETAREDNDRVNQIHYGAKQQAWKSESNRALFLMGMIFICFLYLMRVLFVTYIENLLKAMLVFFIMKEALALSIMFALLSYFIKDDGKSFNQMLKVYGFYDCLFRVPLVIIGWFCGLLTLKIIMPLCALILNWMYGPSTSVEAIGDLGYSLFYILIYTIGYIASFIVAANTTNTLAEKCIKEFAHDGGSFSEGASQQAQADIKKALAMTVR